MKREIIATDQPVTDSNPYYGNLAGQTTLMADGRRVPVEEILKITQTSRKAQHVLSSDFFVAQVEAAYICTECDFRGIFKSECCARCGERL